MSRRTPPPRCFRSPSCEHVIGASAHLPVVETGRCTTSSRPRRARRGCPGPWATPRGRRSVPPRRIVRWPAGPYCHAARSRWEVFPETPAAAELGRKAHFKGNPATFRIAPGGRGAHIMRYLAVPEMPHQISGLRSGIAAGWRNGTRCRIAPSRRRRRSAGSRTRRRLSGPGIRRGPSSGAPDVSSSWRQRTWPRIRWQPPRGRL